MITGRMFRDGILSGANNLINNRREVDALNIFPVPDGDTGTNMSAAVSAATSAVAPLPDDVGISEVSRRCAAALLRGARGNSGVILSLIFKGMANALKGLYEANGEDLANALKEGADCAYASVMNPCEGTILSVIRSASSSAKEALKSETDAVGVFGAALNGAKYALSATPEQMPILKEAGVVDAGGQGLVLLLEGLGSVFFDGVIIPLLSDVPFPAVSLNKAGESDETIKYAYCSEFLIEKSDEAKEKSIGLLRDKLKRMGDCVVVVDDGDIIKVHVHSNCPGAVLQSGLRYGQLTNIKIDNMRIQHRNVSLKAEKNATPSERDYGFAVVCTGKGIEELFTDLGADVLIQGGQTMNPSAEEIVNAVSNVRAKTVFLLPNNKNIIMTAKQAAELLRDQDIRVLETKNIPEGIAAMLAFSEEEEAGENELSMLHAAEQVTAGQVTYASKDAKTNGSVIRKGQALGLCGGKIQVVGDDREETAYRLCNSMFTPKTNTMMTILYGADISESEAYRLERRIKERYKNDIEITVADGGQPIYCYLISVV